MLRALYTSASLRSATALGVGGVAFALSNLILARTLSSQAYGLVSLVIGIVSVAGIVAPMGLDVVIGRRGLPLDSALRRATIAASAVVGIVTAALAAAVYRLGPELLLCVLVITVSAGFTQAGAAHFQGQRQFGTAVVLLQLWNWALIPVAAITAGLGVDSATVPCVLMAATGVLVASVVRLLTGRDQPSGDVQPRHPGSLLDEALSLMTIQASSAVLLQLERLLLVPTVGVHDLALFGVTAALVGSPFRMLQAAVQFTLIPELRAAEGLRERRRLLRREILQVTIAIVSGSVVIWFVAPPLAHWFLSGRYDLSPGLMTAALLSGVLKVFCAFSLAIVVALAQDTGLRTLGVVSWASIGVSVIAAFIAAPWGLVGVLYAISTGWLVRSVVVTCMAIPPLRKTVKPTSAVRPRRSPAG